MTNAIYWLIASGAFFLLEAFGVPGVGFLFAALGAIAAAGAVSLGLIADEAIILQLAICFVVTALSAALLWRKLKAWRMNPNAPHYSNIVGTEGETVEMLSGDKLGTVRWSGTLMRARLADPSQPAIPAGATVRITAIDGNVLIVTTK